jgi:hypothetical protein
MGGVLTDLVRWVIDVVHSLGYVGVFALILAGSVYLPVPTELTLPLFGFLIGNGCLSFAPVLLTATSPLPSGSSGAGGTHTGRRSPVCAGVTARRLRELDFPEDLAIIEVLTS